MQALQKGNCIVSTQGNMNVEVEHIVYNSKKMKPGSMFICIEGANFDGHDFVWEAIEKGAVVVVCSKPLSLKKEIAQILVYDCRIALAVLSAAFYHHPADHLSLIGITGTKGKTTTSYMIKSILEAAGVKTGLIGTVKIDTVLQEIPSSQTTPESLELQSYLREMADAGCKVVVMEVSSQALKLNRVYGLHFDVAILTNVEEDHISPHEHPDFDDYIACKGKLFRQSDTGIINIDTPHWQQVLEGQKCKRIITYGFSTKADVSGEVLDYIRMKEKFAVEFHVKGRYNIKLVVGAPGDFSVENAMAAICAVKAYGVSDHMIKEGLMTFSAPGRQEVFAMGYDKTIVVDYAHNGIALSALLSGLRKYEPNRLTCVFGCGGERDRRRRYHMGEAAAEYADFSIITADNPRNESPTAIINDIIDKIEVCHGVYCVIEDRREAIDYAVRACTAGEIVVIAGKGHENYQIIGSEKIHFDDREVVRASIEKVKDEQNNNRRNQKSDGRAALIRK